MSGTGAPVLIAAVSGRALAASARRAGFAPLVVDRFGDVDLRDVAEASVVIEGGPADPFEAGPLVEALAALEGRSPEPPLGLVLGAGFEPTPDLVDLLAGRWRLLGCGPEAVRASKDPLGFARLCRLQGVPHPPVATDPPGDPAGWLVKSAGGSGGLHVAEASEGTAAAPGRYWQRREHGTPLSLLAVATRDDLVPVGFSRQWASPGEGAPFRYGGAAGPMPVPEPLASVLFGEAVRLSGALGLVGLVSFDWLAAGEDHVLLEVNPRPGATLDVFDDGAGALFSAHVAASLGQDPVPRSPPIRARAAAIAWADASHVTVPPLAWPAWAADRSAPGTVIPKGGPLCTVTAEAGDADEAAALALRRVAEIGRMLYPASGGKDVG
jgi:predicted ATP-grasp superfamily ATP-dependent carboligase